MAAPVHVPTVSPAPARGGEPVVARTPAHERTASRPAEAAPGPTPASEHTPSRPPDRRARRRAATIAEIEQAALDVMAEGGAAGLSLGEVARRVGMRTPSLYEYFASKNALYDALFGRGWCELAAEIGLPPDTLETATDAAALFAERTAAFVRWAVEHRTLAQLMFWRPVPGFTPSADSYGHAQRVQDTLTHAVQTLVARGVLHPDAATGGGVALYTSLVTGVISQALANEPGIAYENGTFTALTPQVVGMFLHRFAPERATRPATEPATGPTTRRRPSCPP